MVNKKDLSEEDMAAFAEAMQGIDRHEPQQETPYRRKRAPRPLHLGDGSKEGDELADLSVETPEFFDFRRPGIQHRVYQDLKSGFFQPEDTLDLHGMRVVEARPAFARFLKSALQRGQRCVRVVHGKGRGSEDRQPVLKQKTFQWLQQQEAVLAFVTAPSWDGGSGATYVLLSRKYRDRPA